jgi:Transposase
MRPPGTPRQPLGEVSPNTRSRVIGARDHGIKFGAISRLENLDDSTCRKIYKNASHQTSCISNPRTGAPSMLTLLDHRNIRRAIVINPKITAAQLRVSCAPHASKKTIYRYLLKSGIQKWRAKQRPFLTAKHALLRMEWALKHNGKLVEFWRRLRWSDECSIERGKGGAI